MVGDAAERVVQATRTQMARTAAARAPRPKKEKPETPQDRLKKRVADELGLMEKVRQGGWGNLTAAETGRIGGIMTRLTRRGLLKPEEMASAGEKV
ncbi:MAG TPA: small, acid-soluble spore protein, alpha/beta type [Bacillota bacterium]